ncbi:Succinate-semialdehyde dehydrogenase, mitochondrial [Nymphon striatum]|nr:Succinate-semialdehyde dehydrogenase, mitochondrial [Nymphon striatum]
MALIPSQSDEIEKLTLPGDLDPVSLHVADATSKGGKVVIGGKKSKFSPNCYEPTLITGLKPDMLICKEETFGPVAAIMKFKTEEEAVHLANLPKTGLAGYFYSQDHKQIWRVAKKLEVGMLGINEGVFSSAEIPFGGIKESGIGREGSKYGLDEYTDIRFVCFGDLSS